MVMRKPFDVSIPTSHCSEVLLRKALKLLYQNHFIEAFQYVRHGSDCNCHMDHFHLRIEPDRDCKIDLETFSGFFNCPPLRARRNVKLDFWIKDVVFTEPWQYKNRGFIDITYSPNYVIVFDPKFDKGFEYMYSKSHRYNHI